MCGSGERWRKGYGKVCVDVVKIRRVGGEVMTEDERMWLRRTKRENSFLFTVKAGVRVPLFKYNPNTVRCYRKHPVI